MKKHHTTILLLILFFTGLICLWWADYAEIPTKEKAREMVNRVLPELIDLKPADINRIEVAPKGGKTLVVERLGSDDWQLIEPVNAAADPSLVETLARNLKDLRKSPDAGTIHEPAAGFGLAPAEATIRVFGGEPSKLLATLELGKTINDRRYVHETGVEGIEVVDARLLSAADRPPSEWRDKALLRIPTFRVASFSVVGPGRDLKAERDEGHWELLRPVRAPADDAKVEELLAEFSGLRVVGGAEGFVADNVSDDKPYGLDKPEMTIELTPAKEQGKPQLLFIGKPIPGHGDRFYARRGDQDDVVAVESKVLGAAGINPVTLRSRKVADINPARVESIRIDSPAASFSIERTEKGWILPDQKNAPADAQAVQSLLTRLNDLQTSEFLETAKVDQAGLVPPSMTIKVWQPRDRKKDEKKPAGETRTAPDVSLHLGRRDALRKTIFARLEGDKVVLALPDSLLDVLPENAFSFRDRTILRESPAQITRLTIRRNGHVFELSAPDSSGAVNQWRLRAPIEARADAENVTRMLLILAALRAERIVSDTLGDGKAYGLDQPWLSATWTTSPESKSPKDKAKDNEKPVTQTLTVGSKRPGTQTYFATVTGQPFVFTLSLASVQPFEEEFRDRRVLAFKVDDVERVILRWPARMLSFVRAPKTSAGPIHWTPELGQDVSGFDVSRIESLVKALSDLKALKFAQYKGSIPPSNGLAPPRLVVQLQMVGGKDSRRLRLGNTTGEGEFFAATGTAVEGPVFLLSGPSWTDLANPPRSPDDLPEDVFAPANAK